MRAHTHTHTHTHTRTHTQILEADIDICFSTYLADRKLAATIADLEMYVCKVKGCQSYEQLRMGPLLSHSRVQRYFAPLPSMTRIPQVNMR